MFWLASAADMNGPENEKQLHVDISKDKTLDPVPRSRLIVVSDVHAPTPTLKALLLYLLLTGLLAAYSPLGVSSVGADAVLASANSVFSTPSLDQQANSNGDAGVECADDPICQAPCASGCIALTSVVPDVTSSWLPYRTRRGQLSPAFLPAHRAGLLRPPRPLRS